MYIIRDEKWVEIGSNPNWCNDLGWLCTAPCDEQEQLGKPAKKRCGYFRRYFKGHKNYEYTNEHEKKFLRICGKQDTPDGAYPLDRNELLLKYPKCLNFRTKWGDLTKEVCLANHKQELEREGLDG